MNGNTRIIIILTRRSRIANIRNTNIRRDKLSDTCNNTPVIMENGGENSANKLMVGEHRWGQNEQPRNDDKNARRLLLNPINVPNPNVIKAKVRGGR